MELNGNYKHNSVYSGGISVSVYFRSVFFKFPFIPSEFPFQYISVSVFFQISVHSSGISVSVYFRFRIFFKFPFLLLSQKMEKNCFITIPGIWKIYVEIESRALHPRFIPQNFRLFRRNFRFRLFPFPYFFKFPFIPAEFPFLYFREFRFCVTMEISGKFSV